MEKANSSSEGFQKKHNVNTRNKARRNNESHKG
jgi:hypothetical protein